MNKAGRCSRLGAYTLARRAKGRQTTTQVGLETGHTLGRKEPVTVRGVAWASCRQGLVTLYPLTTGTPNTHTFLVRWQVTTPWS